MKTKSFFLIASIIACNACGGKSTQTTTDTQTKIDGPRIIDTNKLPAGSKYKEERAVNPANPPIALNYTDRNLKMKPLDISNHFKSVRYITLTHPLPEDQGGFLYDAMYTITYERGMSSGGITTDVLYSDKYIITSDNIFGSYVYDQQGNLTDTIIALNFKKKYKSNPQTIDFESKDMQVWIPGKNIYQSIYTYSTIDTSKNITTCWYDLEKKQMIQKQALVKSAIPPVVNMLTPDSYSSVYSTRFKSGTKFLRTFSISGDTLCEFTNYIAPSIDLKGNINNPDNNFGYILQDKQYIRQAYSDTVFCISSDHCLTPTYIFDFGMQRLDINTGLKGDKADKFIPYKWVETPSFIFFTYTKNYDCLNTRNNGTITFFYSWYDKVNKQLYHIPSEGVFPEEMLIPNPLPDGIPFSSDLITCQDNKLVLFYTRKRLEDIMKFKTFNSLPEAQQAKTKALYNGMTNQQMIVMVIE